MTTWNIPIKRKKNANTSRRRFFSSSALVETVGKHSTTLRAVLPLAAACAHASSVAGVYTTAATKTHTRMSVNVARSPRALTRSSHRCPTYAGRSRRFVANGTKSSLTPTCRLWMWMSVRTSGEWSILVHK